MQPGERKSEAHTYAHTHMRSRTNACVRAHPYRWRRAARQLLNQLYRAKFVMGDLIEDVDDLHDKDKAGTRTTN